LKGEIISGHNTRAGQQDRSVRKGLASVEVADQFIKTALDLIHIGLSLEAENPTHCLLSKQIQKNGLSDRASCPRKGSPSFGHPDG
jgi:hypothetical protein